MVSSKTYCLFLLFFTASLICLGQSHNNWVIIDQHTRKAPKSAEGSVKALHDYLVIPAKTDKDKLRSFYSWITNNIAYDDAAVRLSYSRINKGTADVLMRRKAVCLGYSQLLEALCEEAGIPSEIIIGYVKPHPGAIPDTEAPDHSWNAVFLEGKWQLLDLTWASGIVQQPSLFPRRSGEDYFLAAPAKFLLDHLPGDPAWQLLDCPFKLDEFRSPAFNPQKTSPDPANCIDFEAKILELRSLPRRAKLVMEFRRTYDYNPTESNKKEVGHALMDYFQYLSAGEEQLQLTDSTEALLAVQEQMLQVAASAEQFVQLYDWQKENIARTHLNYAVGLSRKLSGNASGSKEILTKMHYHLQLCQELLLSLPANFLLNRALDQCREYLNYTKTALDSLEEDK